MRLAVRKAHRLIGLAIFTPCRAYQADSRMAGRDTGQGAFSPHRHDQGGGFMKVSPASDIVGIASSFGIGVPQYKEIKRDEEAYEIAHRWPMLAELHGFASQLSEENGLNLDAAGAAAAPATQVPPQEKSGLKVVSAAGQNAENQYQSLAEQVQIAA